MNRTESDGFGGGESQEKGGESQEKEGHGHRDDRSYWSDSHAERLPGSGNARNRSLINLWTTRRLWITDSMMVTRSAAGALAKCVLRCGTVDSHRGYADQPDGRWSHEDRSYTGPSWNRPAGYGESQREDRGAGADPLNDPLTGDLPGEPPVPRYRTESIDLGSLRGNTPNPAPKTAPIPIPTPTAAPPGAPPPTPASGPIPSQASGPPAVPTMGHHDLYNPIHDSTGPLPTVSSAFPGQHGAPASPSQVSQPTPTSVHTGTGVYKTKRTGLAIALIAATIVVEIPMVRAFLAAAFASTVVIDRTIASLLMVVGLPFFGLGCYAALGGAAGTPGQGVRVWFRTPLAYLPISIAIFLAAAVASR